MGNVKRIYVDFRIVMETVFLTVMKNLHRNMCMKKVIQHLLLMK